MSSLPITVSSEDIGRRVLSEDVHDRLLRMIASGALPPGTKLVETHLAKQLGVSQAPVREALRKLEAAGIVEIQPYRGSIVRDPSSVELVNALVVRARLEALAGELATPFMTGEILQRLESLARGMTEAGSEGNLFESVRLNTEFHGLIVEASGNDALLRLWGRLEPFTRAFVTSFTAEIVTVDLGRGHAAIVELIRKGDPALVASALEHHVLEARQVLIDSADGVEELSG